MNKDIVFLTSNELNKSPWKKRIRNFSLFFNCKPLNISKPYNNISDHIASKKKYLKYINFYIKHKNSKYLEFRDLIKNIAK
jgi:hypothetical protein